MADAPAVQFYFGDFLVATAHLTLEERGAYITLLGYAWAHPEGLPEETQKLARVVGVGNKKMRSLWTELERFFKLENGAYFNGRMEEERLKQAQFRAQRVEAGRKGGLSTRLSGATSKTQAKPKPSSSSSLERVKPVEPLSPFDNLEGEGAVA